jgi:hypothetical protein
VKDGVDLMLQLGKASTSINVVFPIGGLRGGDSGGKDLLDHKGWRVSTRAVGGLRGGVEGAVMLRQRKGETNGEGAEGDEAVVR